MHLLATLILLSSVIPFNCTWASTLEPESDIQDSPKLNYTELFPPSSHLTSSSSTNVVELLIQALQPYEKPDYYWLLSHFPILSVVTVEVLPHFSEISMILMNPLLMNMLRPNGSLLTIPHEVMSSLEVIKDASNTDVFRETFVNIHKYMLGQLLKEGNVPRDQYPMVLSAWAEKYESKRRAFNNLAGLIDEGFSGERQRILLHELAYFLNLISFETTFEALRMHKQGDLFQNTGKYFGRLFVGWWKAS